MLKSLAELLTEKTAHVRTLDARTAMTECRECKGVLIDVREPAENQLRATGGSYNIPRGVIEMKLPEMCPQASHPIYLHCATGGRARLAAAQLLSLGYENVTAISCPLDTICEVFGNE